MRRTEQLTDGVVTLRPWRVEDAAFYLECTQDAESQRYTSDPPTLTEADVVAAIQLLPGAADRAGWLIQDASTGQRLGNIAVDVADGAAGISYAVAPAARGKGAATRALRLVVDELLARPDIQYVHLWTHEQNVASRRVAERAGFTRHPDDDCSRVVKGLTWWTVGYRRGR